MKSTQRRVSTKESCSCTSCVYKSESDHPSLRKMITRGSKIDRLYYGRYLPLRERNLLAKLVRTRAEYDDIRKLLLSGSSSSDVANKGDLKPRIRGQSTKKEAISLENTSLSALVDMVDKGVVLESHNLSDCCSCCSCSSKMNLQDENSKLRRNVHMHPPPPAAYIDSRTRVEARSARRARNVRFRTKHIRSDPCTCTFKFSGLMKKHRSKSKFMKPHEHQPEPVLERFQATTERRTHRVGKGQRIVKSTFEKIQGSKTRLMENIDTNIRSSLNKLHESQTKLKESFRASVKRSKEALMTSAHRSKEVLKASGRKSKEALRNTSKKSKEALKATTTKSLEKIRLAKQKAGNEFKTRRIEVPAEGADVSLEENKKQKLFKIKKDSITKYREEIERKREMKDWECQFDCYPDECLPEECYKTLKLHRKHKEYPRKRGIEYKRDKGIGEETSFKIEIKKDYKNRRGKKELHHEVKEKQREIRNNENRIFVKEELRQISRSLTNLEKKIGEQMDQQRHFIRTTSASVVQKHHKPKSKGKHKSIEVKPTFKDSQVESHALKRCFCTLKLKPKKTKSKIKKKIALSCMCIEHIEKKQSITEGIQTKVTNSPSKTTSKQNYIQNLKPYECEPFICVPGECNPIECEKLIRKRNVKHRSILTATNQPISESSDTINKPVSRSSSKDTLTPTMPKQEARPALEQALNKNIISTPNKRVVRISSSFDFNIEIYKEHPNNPIPKERKTDSKRIKPKRSRMSSNEHTQPGHLKNKRLIKEKQSQISSSTGKSKKTLTKKTLSKCFCVLKLGKPAKRRLKSNLMRLSKGTLTSLQDNVPEEKPVGKNISVMTNKVNKKTVNPKTLLLPFECEPGECFPYKCIELIKRRGIINSKTRSTKANTSQRRTKSPSSFTSRSNTPSKPKQVQSTIMRKQSTLHKSGYPWQKLSKKEMEHERSYISSHISPMNPNRKAVKIGSSFNLSIEFYKENPSFPEPVLKEIENHRASRLKNLSKEDPHSYAVKKIKEKVRKDSRSNTMNRKSKGFLTTGFHSTAMECKNAKISTSKTKERLPRAIETACACTRTNEKYLSPLEPYECEPFICVPGECNPYQCLKRIQRRQVKQIGISTTHSKLKSTSSVTPSSLVICKCKSINKKRKHTKNMPLLDDSANISRQVVGFRSSLSFDIEISKRCSSAKKSEIRPSSLFNVLKNQNKSVGQDKTPTNKIKVVNRGSEIGKILKRCFCTSQLHNKNKILQKLKKNTNVYTVSMVTVDNTNIFNKHSKVLRNGNIREEKNSLKPNCYEDKNKPCFDPNEVPSTLDSFRYLKYHDENDWLLNYVSKTTYCSDCPSDIMGASRYLKRCFCTMNIQVANKQKYKPRRKLEPNECEPGVCIPYECDPLECEKLIMKRLMKQASKLTGTTISSRSSYTSHDAGSKTRKLQSTSINKNKQPKVRKQTSPVLNYQKPPKTNRQAVRVGSCFKFNVEFSKERSEPSRPTDFESPEDYQARPSVTRSLNNRQKHRTKSTKDYKVGRLDRDTQSFIQKMENKASNGTPLLKRCFCTLKLHEKRGEKPMLKEKVSHGTATSYKKLPKPPKLTQSQGTITKSQKLKRNVEPYECDPGICIPGECNPYECLELIKIRNKRYRDFGTDSIRQQNTSTKTGMKSDKNKKKQVQSNFKESSRRQKVEKTVPVVPLRIIKPVGQQKHARQAVRIGSSFSFNVEFYKEKIQPKIPVSYQVPQGEIKFTVKPKSQSKSGSKSCPKSCQDKKECTNAHCQMNSSQTGKSTMTKSYLERCFCTAKLHGVPQKTKYHKPEIKHSTKSIPKSISASAQTHKIKTKREKLIRNLEPYECEPGVCIPGQCDPYECEKRIKRRNATGTQAKINPGTSTSSMTLSPKPKNMNAQYRSRPKKTPRNKETSSAKSIVIKSQVQRKSEQTSKQAVRIGSSFSFDVEFFKDKSHCDNKLPKLQLQHESKKPIKVSDSTSYQLNNYKNRMIQGRKSTRDNDSQVLAGKMHSTMTQMTPMLKRCFCTLKLHKNKGKKLPKTSDSTAIQNNMKFKDNRHQAAMVDKGTKTGKYKTYKSPVTTLEPYECEPGVCVPGQCDPYECDKRIQMRNKKMCSQLTGTKNPKVTSSYASDATKYKGREIQAASRPHKVKKVPKINESNYAGTKKPPLASGNRSNRNAVRIGSTFSFDVEFFKDRTRRFSPDQSYRVNEKKSSKNGNNMSQSTKSTYQGVRFHHRPSQNTGPTTMSTGSGVGSILKRCFCTLKLQKNDRHQNNTKYREMDDSNKGNCREMKKRERKLNIRTNPPVTLVYNAATIVNRNFPRSQTWQYDPVKACTPSHVTDDECFKCMKMYQIRNLGTEIKRVTTTSSTSKQRVLKTKPLKKRNKQSMKCKNVEVCKNEQNGKSRINNYNLQADCIGSEFRFNTDLFKNSAAFSNTNIHNMRRRLSKIITSKVIIKNEDLKSKYPGISRKMIYDQSVQTGLQVESRGTGMKDFFKRCFCILKSSIFSTNTKHMSNMVLNKVEAKSFKFFNNKSLYVSGATQKIHINPDVKRTPCECESNLCIPEESNLHKYLENNKKRLHTKTLPSKIVIKKPNITNNVEIPSQKTVKTLKSDNKEANYNKNGSSTTKGHGLKKDKTNRKSAVVIDNPYRKKNNLIKTDFTGFKKKIEKNYTVGRIEIDHKKKPLAFQPQELVVSYQISLSNFSRSKKRTPTRKPSCTAIHQQKRNKTKRSNFKFLCKKKSCYEQCTCTGECNLERKKYPRKDGLHKMEVILPYKSSKFKKNISKTQISPGSKNKVENSTCCSSCTCANCKLRRQKKQTKSDKDKNPEVASISHTQKESFLKRITRIYKEKILSNKEPVLKRDEDRLKTNELNGVLRKSKLTNRTDILKYSKSERCPESSKKMKQEPKKSKSLKSVKIFNMKNKNNCPCKEINNKSISNKIPTGDTNDKLNYQKYMKKQAGDGNYKLDKKAVIDDKHKKVKFLPVKSLKYNKPKTTPGCVERIKPYGLKIAIKSKSLKLQSDNQVIGKYFVDQSPPITPDITPPITPCISPHISPTVSTKSSDVSSKGKGGTKGNNICKELIGLTTKFGHKASKGKTVECAKQQILEQNASDIQAAPKQKGKKKNKKSIIDQTSPETKRKIKNKKPILDQNITSSEIKGKNKIKKQIANENITDIPTSSNIKQKGNIKKQTKESKDSPNKVNAKMSKKQSNKICECVSNKVPLKTCVKQSCLSIISKSINIFKKPKLIPKDVCSCARIYKKTLAKEKKLAQKRNVAEQRQKILKKKKEQKRKIKLEKKKHAEARRKKAEARERIQMKENDKAYQKRLKAYQKEDELRAKARLKSDNAAMKLKRSDVLLCADSLCDVAKIGGRGVETVGVTFFRFITDPRYAKYKVKATWRFVRAKPGEAIKVVVKYPFHTVFSLLGRIKRRAEVMNMTKIANNKLRQYGVTSAMLDTVQGKQQKKKLKRKKKEREPMDFQCNLYMASLRRRPYLAVYYMCPGFYPHFVSIFLALKQFLQMSMLLLAVVVWCPCILCVELCRAFLCCCVCTQ